MKLENYDAIAKQGNVSFSTEERGLLDKFQTSLGIGDGEFLQLLILIATHLQPLNAPKLRTVRLPKP